MVNFTNTLILSSHLRLGLPSDLFPSGFTIKTLYTPFVSPIRATRTAHIIFLDLITRIIYNNIVIYFINFYWFMNVA
jgi:hypothetical protein